MIRMVGFALTLATLSACTAQQSDDFAARLHRISAATNQNQIGQAASVTGVSAGQKVYNSSDCTGPVIMGECHGAIIDAGAYHPTCHGEMLNGQCTGPLF